MVIYVFQKGKIFMKLLVLDGNSILNRAFYGVKTLSTKDGMFTNGIFGFMNILFSLTENYKPDAVAVAFDVKHPTFRHELYKDYKGNRKGMPEELAVQLPVLKDLLVSLGYKLIECPGWEADDIIGTLAKSCKDGDFCYIATGDRDSLQLVDENVNVAGFGLPGAHASAAADSQRNAKSSSASFSSFVGIPTSTDNC